MGCLNVAKLNFILWRRARRAFSCSGTQGCLEQDGWGGNPSWMWGQKEEAGEYEISLGYILRPWFKKLTHRGLGL